jgi:hypothetical protein
LCNKARTNEEYERRTHADILRCVFCQREYWTDRGDAIDVSDQEVLAINFLKSDHICKSADADVFQLITLKILVLVLLIYPLLASSPAIH